MSQHTPLVECDSCGQYHRRGYRGDCRNNAERFSTPDNPTIKGLFTSIDQAYAEIDRLRAVNTDLLAALEQLLTAKRGELDWDAARAAIAKAKGAAPWCVCDPAAPHVCWDRDIAKAKGE